MCQVEQCVRDKFSNRWDRYAINKNWQFRANSDVQNCLFFEKTSLTSN